MLEPGVYDDNGECGKIFEGISNVFKRESDCSIVSVTRSANVSATFHCALFKSMYDTKLEDL